MHTLKKGGDCTSLSKKEQKTESYSLRRKVVLALAVLTIVLYIKDVIITLSILPDNVGLNYVRTLSQDPTSLVYTSRSNIESAIRLLLIQPFVLGLQVIVPHELINNRTRFSALLVVLDVSILILRTIAEGSRALMVYFCIHFVVAVYIYSKRNKISPSELLRNLNKNTKRMVLILVGLLAAALLMITVMRFGSRFFRNIYYYFSIEPRMLEYWSAEVNKTGVLGLGSTSFNGLVYPVIYVIKNALGLEYPDAWYQGIFLLINETDKVWISIASDGTTANAYVSIFWAPYVDGRLIGVVVVLALTGMATMYLYFKSASSMIYSALFSLAVQGLLFSFVRFQLTDVSYALCLVYIRCFAYKNLSNPLRARLTNWIRVCKQ